MQLFSKIERNQKTGPGRIQDSACPSEAVGEGGPLHLALLGIVVLSLWGCRPVNLSGNEGHECRDLTPPEYSYDCSFGRCDPGLRCTIDRICVAEDTPRREDDCCYLSEQCEENLLCGSWPSKCHRPCADLFEDIDECHDGEMCQAELTDDGNWIGICLPSWCDTDEECTQEEVCIKGNQSAGSCLTACLLSVESGTYKDNCISADDEVLACQPLGISREALVCLATHENAAMAGEACSTIKNPCQRGLACIDDICLQYCSPRTPVCADHEVCVERSVGEDVIYFCR